MSIDKLFKPNEQSSIEYREHISELYQSLKNKKEKELNDILAQKLTIGTIPYVFRAIGIPAGDIELAPKNLAHIVGFGQELVKTTYVHEHDISLKELFYIPDMICNPHAIFRSNTEPNSSIIVCSEIENRNNPTIIACKVNIQNLLSSSSIVLSVYEKDKSPEKFFSNLYKYGYCIYDSLESKYFESIKIGAGARNRKVGPIPTYAVACTAPQDKALSTEGISPSINYRVLTKSDIIKKYKENSNEVIAILNEDKEIAIKAERNLSELGYHTIIPNSLNSKEIAILIKSATAIACDRDTIQKFSILQTNTTSIRKVGQAIDFMPEPIFKYKKITLSMMLKEVGYSS